MLDITLLYILAVPLSLRISLLADLTLMLPLAVCVAGWIALSDKKLALRWCGALIVAGTLVSASKLVWALWGLTLPLVNFRMISGHMVVAFAVWPPIWSSLFEEAKPGAGRWGRIIAYAGCVMIGISRLFGAHTLAEVLAGAAIGITIEIWFSRHQRAIALPRHWRVLTVTLVIGISILQHESQANTTKWFNEIAASFRGSLSWLPLT